jgi:flavin-dependent dehydrogenase
LIDLLVAGGGPAGLVTALLAARAGLGVTVLEPRAAPIDKACGEGLMPGAVSVLRSLGVPVAGRPFNGIHYADARREVDALFGNGAGLGVRRTTLHAALSSAVAAAGIEVRSIAAGPVEQDAASVTAAGIKAHYLAAADGLHSPIRRQLGLERAAGGPARYGLRRHFAVAPWTDLVEVHWARGVEAYVTPVAPDLVGVAVLTSVRAPFDDQLAGFPALTARLVDPVGAVRGAGPLRQRAASRVSGRVLLVGDAAGYVDALTGEGLAVAWAAAAQLVACVAADRPAEYERRWRQASRRYRTLTGALLWTRNQPLLARAIVPAAQRLPWAFELIVNQLAR